MKRFFFSHLYRDDYPDIDRATLLAGTGRSGTTWLADLIASPGRCRVLFEPFHSEKVPAFRRFAYFQYMRPHEANAELEAVCNSILAGRIRHPFVDRAVTVLRPQCRVIKEIRANLFLRWMRVHFPSLPILFIIRHPCAVVASRMELGWATDSDLAPMLMQEKLVEDFLYDKMDIIAGAKTPASKHALIWCISNLVPLRQFPPGELNVVFYENLCADPHREVPRILSALGRDMSHSALAQTAKPSATSLFSSAVTTGANKLDRWRSCLTSEQVSEIRKIVEAFELDHLYKDALTPQTEIAL